MSVFSPPNTAEVQRIIVNALREDIGEGDLTSQLLIPENLSAKLALVAREPFIVCGLQTVIARVFPADASFEALHEDGELIEEGDVLAIIEGNARALLAAERTALNLLQRMCAVASLTAEYVEAVVGTDAIILDTRKTMPGLRELDKYAVRVGGGQNHRMRLDDMILIKDNHIALAGGVRQAVERALANVPQGKKIVVECDTLAQVEAALPLGVDRLLLDNMTPEMLREAAEMVGQRVKLEASGGVNIENVRDIAMAGVDYISIGKITHSVSAVDIGLDIAFDDA